MTRHRRRARIDSDRFGHMRDRERFLYERHDTDDVYQDGIGRPSIRAFLLAGFCTLMLAGTVIFTAHYLGEQSADRQMAVARPAPELAAALPVTAEGPQHDSDDRKVAQIAWQYFENNYHNTTGLVNSVDGIETTTVWDTGSSIAAFLAARDFELITQHDFDHRVMALLQTLASITLVNDAAPNLLYNTRTARMVDYDNQITDQGIGSSAIDLARTAFWLNTLQCMHPKYFNPTKLVLDRWDYNVLIKDGELYGLARDSETVGNASSIRQGRFGFEQYAGLIFRALGHPSDVSADYDNKYRANTEILGVMIAHDNRDPRNTGVNNFVLTDSYTLDAMELGIRTDNQTLVDNIFKVQKERWRRTGIATALTDGHINQPPYYLYNTIFDAGLPFTTTTDTGLRSEEMRTISTRAGFMLAALFPEDPYSDVLLSAIESAYDPQKGWFSGVYENGGYNDVTTANTNGIILQTMLYKKYGTINNQCRSNGKP
jgi:hypothetical protein